MYPGCMYSGCMYPWCMYKLCMYLLCTSMHDACILVHENMIYIPKCISIHSVNTARLAGAIWCWQTLATIRSPRCSCCLTAASRLLDHHCYQSSLFLREPREDISQDHCRPLQMGICVWYQNIWGNSWYVTGFPFLSHIYTCLLYTSDAADE